ncbi:protein singed wings 2 [Lutzomyia longipalpis]|uniref:protein singed wings 2 n=1 Tax=Lutzomyia longipalpis TaxID=7200 RepID=UPI002483970E|nr:protein singed wings 2 [Lutzomyia longipalpis]
MVRRCCEIIFLIIVDLTISYSHKYSCDEWIATITNETNIESNNYCSQYDNSVYCTGNLEAIQDLKLKMVENLWICRFPNKTFDPYQILRRFTNLKMLRINYSNFTYFSNDFPELKHLEIVNVTNTAMAYTRPTLFRKLPSLRYLDLRGNCLDHMEGPLILNSGFKKMYLSGNKWNCTRNMKWLLTYDENGRGQRVADRELMRCVDFKYSGRPLLAVMDFKLQMRQQCGHPNIKNCSCVLHYIRPSDDGQYLIPMVTVNCSHRGFMDLPDFLPKNTTILHITHNKITSVEMLRTNPIYLEVHDVFVDYNQIHSIDFLEASRWLNNFRVFSLKGNKLTKFSSHILDNALERNHNAIKLHLSENPWRCDCVFTPHFQELLMKYHTIIKDYTNITCKYIEGDSNFRTSVITLNRGDVCKLPSEYRIQPIELLNGILASLIILVLGKLAFDYYHYKRYGRVPWIVTKLP